MANRKIRKFGESIRGAQNRADTPPSVKIDKKPTQMAKVANRGPANFKCKLCDKKDTIEKFKQLDVALRTGVCNYCHNVSLQTARRDLRHSNNLNTHIEQSKTILLKAVNDIGNKFKAEKFPFEAQLMYHILNNTMDTLREINSATGYIGSIAGTKNIKKALAEFENGVILPIILYTLKKVKGNQVKTAQILGISRNTLRDRLWLIADTKPRLLDEYECWNHVPQRGRNKSQQKQRYALEYLRTAGAIEAEVTETSEEDDDYEE